MDKQKSISISIIAVLIAGLLFWALFFDEEKGKMKIIQPSIEQNTEIIEEKPQVEVPVQVENVRRDGIIEKSPEQIIDEFRQEQKKPTQTVIKPEEIIKKPTEFSLEIVDRFMSTGFQKYSGERKVDTVIIHSSYNSLGGDQYDVSKIVDIYKSYGVSAHYIIGRDGVVHRLVKDNDIAYHAGVSKVPDGRTNVNAFSIGIEMVGNKTDGYTEDQYSAVSALVNKLKADYTIKYVLGHDEIAPDRKDDPWEFDWKKLK